MKKILLASLLTVFTLLARGSAKIDPNNYFPFQDEPTLSWAQFEQDFRKRYNHLDIPPIKLARNFVIEHEIHPVFSEALEAGELNEYLKEAVLYEIHQKELLSHCAAYDYKQKIVLCKPTYYQKKQSLTGALLHECGHHKFDPNKRSFLYSQAEQYAKDIASCAQTSVNAIYNILAGYNGYHIIRYKPNPKLLALFGLAQLMKKNQESITVETKDIVRQVYAAKPEEYCADEFVHQNATQEDLIGFRDTFSQQGIEHINKTITQDLLHAFALKADRELPYADYSKSVYNTLMAGYAMLPRKYRDPSHPSPEERYALADKALKERFGHES